MKKDPIGNAKDERMDWSTVILGQDRKAQKVEGHFLNSWNHATSFGETIK